MHYSFSMPYLSMPYLIPMRDSGKGQRIHPAWFVLPLLAVLNCGGLLGQTGQTPTFGAPATQQPPVADAAQVLAGNLGSDPVAAGDLIYISVGGSMELTRSYRIAADGQIAVPLLKEGLMVSGLTPDQIAQVVSHKLVEKRIFKAPIVFAEVLEYRSRLVSVVGAVRSPTVVQAVGDTKLLDAIARAQGLAPEAGPEIVVSRPVPGSNQRETTRISAKALFDGNNPTLNLALHGGEEIRVPEAPKLYIMGNVRQPGVFPLTDLEGSTVLKALALSQGTLSFSAKKAYVYRVAPGAEQRREIEVDLAEILHRKSPDFPLRANDILYIPDNGKLRLSAEVLKSFSGFGTSTLSGLIVWH